VAVRTDSQGTCRRPRGRQAEGHWADYLRLAFHRTTQPTGYTYDDDFGLVPPPSVANPAASAVVAGSEIARRSLRTARLSWARGLSLLQLRKTTP
jgi:hypothetical protein